jgi:DNA invertase Pin-like site-specific DNA recombinase
MDQFVAPNYTLDTTTPSGKALFQMCGVFAEFERAMISERIKAGIARSKQAGKILGRPRAKKNIDAILIERRAGHSIREIAKKHNLATGTVHAVIAANDV